MECLIARERICGPSSVAPIIAPIISKATSISQGRSSGRLDVVHRMDVSTY